jgi:hypothetical protein
VGSLGIKLRYDKGRLSVVREKKPALPLRALGGKALRADALSAVYPVPAAGLLAAFADQEFFVFKLP